MSEQGGLVPAGRVPMPDGPVSLWFAVFDGDGGRMGAARATVAPAWEWRDGRLAVVYGHVRVVMTAPGWYDHAVIIAIPQAAEVAALGAALGGEQGPVPYARLWRIGLGPSHELRAGDDLHIHGGVIGIEPLAAPGQAEPLTGAAGSA